MNRDGEIRQRRAATARADPWWLALYPLWQWLVLVPATAAWTVVSALAAIALSLTGRPGAANVQVAARWARLIAYITPMRVEVIGRENVDPRRSYVVVANHLSQYDIPLIYGFSGMDLRWVMKAELGRVPFIAQGCRAIGHIFIDRGNPDQARQTINDAVAALPEGTGVLFFAEGTRSRSGELMAFRKGAFRVAVDRGLAVLPMTVIGTRALLPPGSLRIRPGRARLVIGAPIEPGCETTTGSSGEAPASPTDNSVGRLCRDTRQAIADALCRHALDTD